MSRRRVNNSFIRNKVLREENEERLAVWRKLTPQQQLDALDERLGKGVGAVKQRARLTKLLKPATKEAEPKAEPSKKAEKPKRKSKKKT